jgi:hypothetical protein
VNLIGFNTGKSVVLFVAVSSVNIRVPKMFNWCFFLLSGNKPNLVPKNLGSAVRQRIDYFRSLLDQLPAGVITMGSFYHPDLCGERKFPFNFPIGVLMKRKCVILCGGRDIFK